jgi:hypothetical protein
MHSPIVRENTYGPRLMPVRQSFKEYETSILRPLTSILQEQFGIIACIFIPLLGFPRNAAEYAEKIIDMQELSTTYVCGNGFSFDMTISTNIRFGFEFRVVTTYEGSGVGGRSQISDPHMRTYSDICAILDNYIALSSRIRVAAAGAPAMIFSNGVMKHSILSDATKSFSTGLQLAFLAASKQYIAQFI